MKPFRRFAISLMVTAALGVVVLLWLGPVWLHDVREHMIATVASVVLVLLVLSLIAGALAGDAASAVAEAAAVAAEASVSGGHAVLKAFGAAGGGMLVGVGLSLVAAWLVAGSQSARLAYARANPQRALAADYIAVAPIIAERPPADAAELARELVDRKVELRYSTIRDGAWRDAWDRPMRYEARTYPLVGTRVKLYSVGADGADDGGRGDDISINDTLTRWKAAVKIATEVLDRLLKRE